MKVITIWISRELLFFNFECLDISWASIIHLSQKLCRLNLSRAFVVQFRACQYIKGLNYTLESKVMQFEFAKSFRVQFRWSRYIMRLNRTSERKVITIWISWELSLYIFECSIYDRPQSYTQVKSYGHFNLPRAFMINFARLDILCAWIGYPSEKLWPFEFHESFCCSISNVPIYHGTQSYTRVKSYAIWIYQEFLLFNFLRLDI